MTAISEGKSSRVDFALFSSEAPERIEWAQKKLNEARGLIARHIPELLPTEDSVLFALNIDVYSRTRGQYCGKLKENHYLAVLVDDSRKLSPGVEEVVTMRVCHELVHQKTYEILETVGMGLFLPDNYSPHDSKRPAPFSVINSAIKTGRRIKEEERILIEGVAMFAEFFLIDRRIDELGEVDQPGLKKALVDYKKRKIEAIKANQREHLLRYTDEGLYVKARGLRLITGVYEIAGVEGILGAIRNFPGNEAELMKLASKSKNDSFQLRIFAGLPAVVTV